MARANQTKPVRVETALKVLLYDLETSPNIGYTWGKWEQNVIQIIKERQIISFAWKWLGDAGVKVLALPDFKEYKNDQDNNRPLVVELHNLFNDADVTVGHNVIDFDDRRSNSDFLRHGLKPPPPHKSVDTLRVARSKFDLNSNKLDDLGALLGLGRKVKHPGFEMWEGCLRGDPKSWALMKKYNKGDVVLLEKIYYELRPWMTNHPNMTIPDALDGCPACRSRKLESRGWVYNSIGKKKRYLCLDCNKWCQGEFVKHKWRFR